MIYLGMVARSALECCVTFGWHAMHELEAAVAQQLLELFLRDSSRWCRLNPKHASGLSTLYKCVDSREQGSLVQDGGDKLFMSLPVYRGVFRPWHPS
jgi:hypothetical protein